MNIFEKYGLKEVADVHFIAIEDDQARGISQGDTVLFLDSLKLSNLSINTEEVKYYGGYGGSVIASWSYNKDVSLTLQDALMSMSSLSLLFGTNIQQSSTQTPVETRRSDVFYLPANLPKVDYQWVSLISGERGSKKGTIGAPSSADMPVRAFWAESMSKQGQALSITIDAESFPGTYRIVGHGKARSVKGHDRNIQFTIPYAKIVSSTPLTMSSEGEPAVFDIELKALARNDSELLQITFYRLLEPLQAYIDVVNGKLVLGGMDLRISLILDEEFLVLRDRDAPPVGYLATLEGDDLVLEHRE